MFLLLYVSTFIPIIHNEINTIENDTRKEILPKMSDQFINITTPENKTYITPMIGHYPATYGFENEKEGSIPDGWHEKSGAGCNIEVVDEFSGHKRVLKLSDQSESNFAKITKTLDPDQKAGTIELWFYPGSSSHSLISLWSNNSLNFLYVQFIYRENNYIRYYDGAYHKFFYGYEEKWYHLRFDIDYNNDQYDIYLDGVKYVEDGLFRNPADECSRIGFRTWQETQGIVYIDAIGLSSDPNYNIGDNIKEGLLLNFESNIDLDWIGYSLDNQANKTILGNTTILMPDNGTHSIQVFGNDSLGNNFESEIRFFTIGPWSPDEEGPTIVINLPASNELFGEAAPPLIVTINDSSGVNTMWYNLNGGTNIIFIANGTIDSTEWGNMPNGTVTITFYANDSVGNVAFASVTVRKDIEGPGAFDPVLILMAILGIISFVIIIGVIMTLMRSRKKQLVIIKEPPKIFPQKVEPEKVEKIEITPSICPNCGTKLSGKEKFCTYCGSEL